ncbi:MAG: pyridine nucleotide-disulfide oxidoreductase [Bacteroidia bacterium]|nr:MAG: pyridine nucleotide-disulfide oxidoreductase [Bacteroidia bacterium]
MSTPAKPKLVVLGTGFGAFSIIKRINTQIFDVVVVSPRNHFLFTPLLPSTTVGTIELRSIIEPIRTARPGILYYHAECIGLNHPKREIRCRGILDGRTFALRYDFLVIAVGASSATFNIPGVREHALFLKELSDARAIRHRIIECLERASHPRSDPEEVQRLLHFVVVGGGPTGVEFLAEMHDFVMEDLRKSYPAVAEQVRLTLLEATDQILGTFDAALRAYTRRLFRRQRIEVRTRSPVTRIGPTRIVLRDGTRIPYGLVVWSAGTAPTPFVQSLRLPRDAASRILVDEHLRVHETSRLFALGDCSSVMGRPYPATAQVAQQQGKYLARALEAYAQGRLPEPFRYKSYGMLAYVGSGKALADLETVKGRGFAAWLFWRSVYLTRLVSIKNKILVVFDWMKTFVFGRDISRF